MSRGVLIVDDDQFIRKLIATTLEDVTQRVHTAYEHRLNDLEARLTHHRNTPAGEADSTRVLSLERELAQANEDARRALKRASAVEATIASAVSTSSALVRSRSSAASSASPNAPG